MSVEMKHEIKMSDKTISFIQPSRNNRKYLEWSYDSIRKHLGYRHEICVFSDYSTDGTVEWCEEISKKEVGIEKIRKCRYYTTGK